MNAILKQQNKVRKTRDSEREIKQTNTWQLNECNVCAQ